MSGLVPLEGVWQKAVASTTGGACVEVSHKHGLVLLRDSKHPGRGSFSYTKTEWNAFMDGVKKGEFDHFGE